MNLHILQHSLGLDQYGEGRQYRNHFVTGAGSKDWDACRALVDAGLMTEQKGHPLLTDGDSVFYVTPAGIDFVALNSPAKPNEPKPSRYTEYLHSEYSEGFAEYLGINAPSCRYDPYRRGWVMSRSEPYGGRTEGECKPTRKEAKASYKEALVNHRECQKQIAIEWREFNKQA